MQLVQNGMITNPEVAMMGMNLGNISELVAKEMAYREQQRQLQIQQGQQSQPTAPNKQSVDKQQLSNVVSQLKDEIYGNRQGV
jgi:UDP-galactopyranose mutase